MSQTTSHDPDLPLVLALQAGDESALSELIARHQENILRFAWGILRHEAEARDITQETFVRAYFAINSFRPDAKFTTWLYRIALNLCRDRIRSASKKRANVTDSLSDASRDIPSASNDPAAALLSAEKNTAIHRAIDALPANLRPSFVLSVIENLPQAECATRLGLTIKAVETRVGRAREFLRGKLASWL